MASSGRFAAGIQASAGGRQGEVEVEGEEEVQIQRVELLKWDAADAGEEVS
jgi:hypothetical protein